VRIYLGREKKERKNEMTLGIMLIGCSLHAPHTAHWLLMEHTLKLSLLAAEAKEEIQVWSFYWGKQCQFVVFHQSVKYRIYLFLPKPR